MECNPVHTFCTCIPTAPYTAYSLVGQNYNSNNLW